MTPIERARKALNALATDEPLVTRIHDALEYLRPLRSVSGFDTTLIESLNDANDTNCTPKERGKMVAALVANILLMSQLE